jgi:hypothetical protein
MCCKIKLGPIFPQNIVLQVTLMTLQIVCKGATSLFCNTSNSFLLSAITLTPEKVFQSTSYSCGWQEKTYMAARKYLMIYGAIVGLIIGIALGLFVGCKDTHCMQRLQDINPILVLSPVGGIGGGIAGALNGYKFKAKVGSVIGGLLGGLVGGCVGWITGLLVIFIILAFYLVID